MTNSRSQEWKLIAEQKYNSCRCFAGQCSRATAHVCGEPAPARLDEEERVRTGILTIKKPPLACRVSYRRRGKRNDTCV
jgi:hypothetical protein